MKQKLSLFLSFLVLVIAANAQKGKGSTEPRRLFGIHMNAIDVKTPMVWKSNSGPKTLAGLTEQDLGLSLSYWQTIRKQLDLSVKGSILFHNYSAVDRNTYNSGYNQVGIEVEPSVNASAFKHESLFNAFLTAGIGAGLYSEKFGAYLPAGVGLSANFSNTTHIFVQTQYRFTLTKDVLKNNIFYSVGIAHKMGKDEPVVVLPPPPPPVVDRDNDGVLDSVDACPDVAGKVELKGCPDRDNDGIADNDDKCPDVAGIAKYNGCPIPDTDGDGINDEADKCVNERGVARYQGCPIPDTDKDGVNDEEDKCPSLAGPASNEGCPVIDEKIIEKVNYAETRIQFEFNSAKLKKSSYKSLDEVVAILKSDNTLLLSIDGHTDNVGDAAVNQKMSENRAAACKDYMVSKGIDASRLKATGYGSTKPVADNKTSAGRAKNRRTDMTINNH